MGHLRAHNIMWALHLCSLLYNNRTILVMFEQWSCFVMLECAGSYVMLCSYYTKTGQTCMRDNWDTGGIVTRWTTWNISAISAADPVYGILATKKKVGGTSVIHFLVFLFVARNQNEPKGHQVVKKVGDMWADGTQSSQIRSSLFCFWKIEVGQVKMLLVKTHQQRIT